MIEVSDLTVRFGGVTPLDKMSVKFNSGTCGLIGPNGAGKTTFFNVLSGFVKPAGGTVHAFGEDLLAMAHYRRARWGVRRTFQTEQAIEELSVYDNVAMIHEHSKMTGGSRREEVLGAIEFVKLDIDPYARVGTLSAAQRRLVEVARSLGCSAHLIDDEGEIRIEWLAGARTVGVTSGASAPEWLVERVVEHLRSLGATTVEQLRTVEEHMAFSLPAAVRHPTG